MRPFDDRRWPTLAAIALAAVALAACGDDDESDSAGDDTTTEETTTQETTAGGGATSLEIDALEQGGQLSFAPKRLTADAGEVTVTMLNPQGNQLPHAVEVEGSGVEEEGETVQAGGTSEVSVDLEPGRYVFYCPVGNHRQAGMEGTLTVR